MANINITTIRPYLIRAFYEWLLDNKLTPYLLIDSNMPGIQVPSVYVSNGQIILNIEPSAVDNLNLGNNRLVFNTRFDGVLYPISIPIEAVLAIYASENGIGTIFDSDHMLFSKKKVNIQKNIDLSLKDNKYENNKNAEKIRTIKNPNLRLIK
ncbi:ClpXP protease specificity-enhancing factor [Candidatus Pantoea edessiphila]|uniref:ClpXP protease specificity-enhancing factor n=1 Tax=Candidatus Pantoea edessiphila TaxID=2044610 RepID=A0A2P5SW48_9GAMM|nr:ClpXP protease specificity-enhancing factor [Candidatus Pantoea edessiphila]PPI86543.1 ClpXP protease specificity-enhancing factor [Candidatus Pantoea edessiphila]